MSDVTILIVDDAEISRGILTNLFKSDYEIRQASDGAAAWEMLNSGVRIDLILLDLIMPQMDGVKLLEKIKTDKRFLSIPIIVNTQQTEAEIEMKVLELGADDYMTKPYNPRILKQKVKNLAEKYILEKRKVENLLQRTSDKLETLTDTIPGGIGVYEIRENNVLQRVYSNEGIGTLLGFTKEEFEAIPSSQNLQFFYKDDQKKLLNRIKEAVNDKTVVENGTFRMVKKDGEVIWVRILARQFKTEGSYPAFYVVLMDITEEKKKEMEFKETIRELQYRSERDVLTGIYNKDRFFEKASEFIKKNLDEQCIIAMWDIDRLKVINELFGSQMGDVVLKNAAKLFEEIVGDFGIFGRIEADHFASCTTWEAFEEFRPKLEEIFEKGVQETAIDYPVYIHAGFYVIEASDMAVDLMCDRAMLALKSVKANAMRRWAFYDSSMSSLIFDEHTMVTEMHAALEAHQFYIMLQPVTDTVTGKIISAEALIRWKHPVRGIIPTRVFIPVFEKNGLITELDVYVWEEVCRLLAENKKRNIPNIPISVNISRLNFYRKDILKILLALVNKYQLSTELLMLEITETAYTDNPEQILSIVKHFQEHGFKILMDDFGSGYSSLNMLKNVSVDALKIDMKFLENIEHSDRSVSILKSIIDMSRRMQIPTAAEGVETQNQFELLRDMGCDTIQGYYFSKPLLAEDFRNYVANHFSRNQIEEEEDKKLPAILVVDDMEMIRVQVMSILEMSYRVFEAENGKEAYEFLQKHSDSIKLVLTDIMMPVMDGYELLSAIGNNVRLSHIPCVVLTASEEAESAIEALSRGAMDVIIKPFEPDVLTARVKNIISMSENKLLQTENQSLRKDNFERQSIRKVLESGSNAICRMKLLEDGRKFEILFANDKYYEFHEIPRNDNDPVYAVDVLYSNLTSAGKKEIDNMLKIKKENKKKLFQLVFTCIMKDGSRKKLLSTSSIHYVRDEVVLETTEVELSETGNVPNNTSPVDYAIEILLKSGQNAWQYDIERDEIEYINMNWYMGGKRTILSNVTDSLPRLPEFMKEDEKRIRQMFTKIKNGDKDISEAFYCRKKDQYGNVTNDYWWNRITYVTYFEENGKPLSAIGVSEDVTEKLFAKGRKKSEDYKEILRRDAYIFAEVDLTENRFAEFYCERADDFDNREIKYYDDMIKRLINDHIYPDEVSYVNGMLNRQQLMNWFHTGEQESRFDFRIKTEAKEYEWYTSIIYFLQSEEDDHIYAIWQIRNVHSEKMRLSHIKKMAEHDSLTGLYNRTAFQKRVEEAFEENASKYLSAFFMLDIDNFKNINDSFGHDFGDNIITTVASQILLNFRKEDSVGRIGGDEFAVFIPRMADKSLAEKKAVELCNKIRMNFDNSGKEVTISCSIGIAFAPEAGASFEELYVHADEALYQAKNAGKNRHVLYQPQ